ncbi:polymorphic toxin type 15 domain-containing protein [Psychrobacter okhotskensis]|uniref:polymorphic toxin type 15 domain-containing protein n=1 Tax=Psychrobacter okhotskensis TaxID=212403 RepID=UPI00300C317A
MEAQKLAAAHTKVIVSDLHALHDPDMVAGGQDKINRLGRGDVNSSIGSQWKHRVAEMDKAAKEAQKTQGGQTKMNVELNRCK